MHWRGQGPRPGPKKKRPPPGRTRGVFFVGSRPWPLALDHHDHDDDDHDQDDDDHDDDDDGDVVEKTPCARPVGASGGFFQETKRLRKQKAPPPSQVAV